MRVNAERTIEILSTKLGQSLAQEAMLQAYVEELEEANRGLVKQREEDAARSANAGEDKK